MGRADAGTRERAALERMLEARSVAVVGASVKAGSLGAQMMAELRRGGYDGAVYPVNPGYEEVDGHRCFASIGEVPEPIDLAILGVANARIEQALSDAAATGAASALTFSSLYEEQPPEPGSPSLAERVAAIAREHGMAFCGGNGMGFLNLEARLRATGFATPDDLRVGPVALLSHSGSAFAAFAFNDRRIGFNLVVSSGQEVVTTMPEYMEYALDLDSTRVLALLLETVRKPERFVDALRLADERKISVVALKVGRTERSKSMVVAHSGALAGEHGAYEALFDAFGVHEVETLDEMADAIELLSCPRRVSTAGGIASVHDSGGERALFADLAADVGVPFARISERTREGLRATLDPGLEAENPLDAWGTGIDADRIFRESLQLLHDDPETSVLALVVDLTRQGEPHDEGYLQVARDVFASTTKPFCVLSNLSSAVAVEEAAVLRDAGIPVLEGSDRGLRALGHLLAERTHRERPPVQPPATVPDDVRERWRHELGSLKIGESSALRLLADYGIPTVAAESASSLGEATDAAARIGYPVAAKTATGGISHKTEVEGVKLGIASDPELETAYVDLASRLGPEVTVAAMAPEGVEIALGVVRDPQFGPLVLVGAGGVLVEVLHDRTLALPPFDEPRARALVSRLAVAPLLEGSRGRQAVDVGSLARALVRLSVLAIDLGDLVEAIDVNPVIVSPAGCLAVDALVVPREATG
ncbi:MAG TPA: acetate--CoA ligase family protein [Actinomycetota bacterium]|nr:acetate--CoA ligase family protein [Actinomycetota bacterium]